MDRDFWVGYKSKSEGGLIYLRRRQRILNAVNGEEHGECLDAGCGRGLFAKELSKRVSEYIGVDVSRRSLLDAKRSGRASFNQIFVVADICHLPFKERTFSLIICTEVLEHISNPVRALCDFSRVLKSRGTLILSVPSLSLCQTVFFFACTKLGILQDKPYQSFRHLREYCRFTFSSKFETISALLKQLEDCNLVVCDYQACWSIYVPLLNLLPFVKNPLAYPRVAKLLAEVDGILSSINRDYGHYTIIKAKKAVQN